MSNSPVHLRLVGGTRSKSHLELLRARELVREIEESVAHHPAGSGLDEREQALRDAQLWSTRIDAAHEAYGLALEECKRLGIPNSRIAAAVGKTESAIRMYLMRKARRLL